MRDDRLPGTKSTGYYYEVVQKRVREKVRNNIYLSITLVRPNHSPSQILLPGFRCL